MHASNCAQEKNKNGLKLESYEEKRIRIVIEPIVAWQASALQFEVTDSTKMYKCNVIESFVIFTTKYSY